MATIKRIAKDTFKDLERLLGSKADEHFWEPGSNFGIRLRRRARPEEDGSTIRVDFYSLKPKRRLGPGNADLIDKVRKLAGISQAQAKLGHIEQSDAAKKKAAVMEAKRLVKTGILFEEYLKKRKKDTTPRSFQEIERHLTRQASDLHKAPIEHIRRRDLVAIIDRIENESGKRAADCVKASISAFFTWAVEQEHVDANPCTGILRRHDNEARERVLAYEEITDIWHEAGEDDYSAIIRLLALSGQRRDEIGALQWREIDFEERLITLPGNAKDKSGQIKFGRTKNGKTHLVPISDAMTVILAAVPRREGRQLLFGRGQGGFSGWSKSKERLDERLYRRRNPDLYNEFKRQLTQRGEDESDAIAQGLGFDDADHLRGSIMPPWRLHDLRRSLDTHCNEEGFGHHHVVESILNHISSNKNGKAGVAGTYNLAQYLNEKRRTLQLWGEHITALVDGRPSTIVPVKTAG